METLVGFAFGFVLGTREGKDGLRKIQQTLQAIMDSADVKHLVGEAATVMAPLMREVARATGG